MGIVSGIAQGTGIGIGATVGVGAAAAGVAALGSAMTTVVTMLGQKVMEHFNQGEGNLGFQEVFRPMLAGGMTVGFGFAILAGVAGLVAGLGAGCEDRTVNLNRSNV